MRRGSGLSSSHPEALIKPGLAAALGPGLPQPLALHQTRTREEVVNTQACTRIVISLYYQYYSSVTHQS